MAIPAGAEKRAVPTVPSRLVPVPAIRHPGAPVVSSVPAKIDTTPELASCRRIIPLSGSATRVFPDRSIAIPPGWTPPDSSSPAVNALTGVTTPVGDITERLWPCPANTE